MIQNNAKEAEEDEDIHGEDEDEGLKQAIEQPLQTN